MVSLTHRERAAVFRWVLFAIFGGIAFSASAGTPPPNFAVRDVLFARRHALFENRYKNRFLQADRDGSGGLSREEAARGMPELAPAFKQIDANQDGEITWAEIQRYRRGAWQARDRAMAARHQRVMRRSGASSVR